MYLLSSFPQHLSRVVGMVVCFIVSCCGWLGCSPSQKQSPLTTIHVLHCSKWIAGSLMKLPFPLRPKSISMFFFLMIMSWQLVAWLSVQTLQFKAYEIKVLWSDLGSCLEPLPVGHRTVKRIFCQTLSWSQLCDFQGVFRFLLLFNYRWLFIKKMGEQKARVPRDGKAAFFGGVEQLNPKNQQQRDLQRWRSMVFFAGLIGWIAMMKMKTSSTCWWTLGCIRLDFLLVDLVDRDDELYPCPRWHVECGIYLQNTTNYKIMCLNPVCSSKSGEKLWCQNLLRAPMPEPMLCMKDVSTAKSIRKMWMHVMRWV